MGLRKLLTNSVDVAFKAAGDLVSPAVFYKKTGAFDFSTNSVSDTVESASVKRVILYASSKKSSGAKNAEAPTTKDTHDLIVESSVINASAFDRVSVNGVFYKILPEITDYEYVSLLKLIKEI